MLTKKTDEIVVTLYEGHYHFGVAALLNSLINAGFKGIFRVGYRGTIPYWISQFKRDSDGDYIINNDIVVTFVLLDINTHFGYYKPKFLIETINNYLLNQRVYYFDPDIVVNAPWPFFSSWVQSGVALCLDNCFSFIHQNHPWRKDWLELADIEPSIKCRINYYVNSGFIGLKRDNMDILTYWDSMTDKYQKIGGNITLFEKEGHRAFKGDQDLLNAVITAYPKLEISLIGTEGMGFSQPAYLMSHAVNTIKPWKKNYVKYLFAKGKSPDFSDVFYIRYANYPIVVFSKPAFFLKKINLKFATILGRIIG